MIKETIIIDLKDVEWYEFSKIWWKPYCSTENINIPKDQYWNDMFLMCQIDCKEFLHTNFLPKNWLLQFFITEIENTVFWSGDTKSNEDFTIRYISEEEIDRSNEFVNIDNWSIAIGFIEKLVNPTSETYEFESFYGSNNFDIWLLDEYNENIIGQYEQYNSYNTIGGFPLWEDIRSDVKKYKDYELLIQIEFLNDERLHKCWDFYNAAIYIKKWNLKKEDFSDCFINFYT